MKNLKMFVFALTVFGAVAFCSNVQNVKAQRGSMEWRGTVDDVTQIVIRNRNARIRHISGRFYNDSNFDFNGRAPRRNADV